MSASDPELRRCYLHFNRKYFAGELPEDAEIVWNQLGQTYADADADPDNECAIIQINPKYAIDARVWKMTLLHEMAHLRAFPVRNHGAKFQAEMLRLSTVGAFSTLW